MPGNSLEPLLKEALGVGEPDQRANAKGIRYPERQPPGGFVVGHHDFQRNQAPLPPFSAQLFNQKIGERFRTMGYEGLGKHENDGIHPDQGTEQDQPIFICFRSPSSPMGTCSRTFQSLQLKSSGSREPFFLGLPRVRQKDAPFEIRCETSPVS